MSTSTGVDLEGVADRLFGDRYPTETVSAIEPTARDLATWPGVAELGFPLVGIDEGNGGAGGSLAELLVVLRVAARHAVPLPLAETSLAAWLLAEVGVQVTDAPMTVVPEVRGLSLADGVLSGVARSVPWGGAVDTVVALVPDVSGAPYVVRLDPKQARTRAGSDLAGMPSDDLHVDDLAVEAWAWKGTPEAVLFRGALLRSAQLAGAIAGAFQLTRDYVTERIQFGRAVSTFQSVQAHVVTLAQAATVTRLSVERAGLAADLGSFELACLAAKAVTSREARLAASAAHQAHGAIGMTREYPLQLLTRRLQAWRSGFGDELAVTTRLGGAAIAAGGLVDAVVDADVNRVEVGVR